MWGDAHALHHLRAAMGAEGRTLDVIVKHVSTCKQSAETHLKVKARSDRWSLKMRYLRQIDKFDKVGREVLAFWDRKESLHL